MSKSFYQAYGKRLLDLTLGTLALVVALPVMIFLALATKAALGSPIFFRQLRPGRDETIFELLKFRTMTDTQDNQGRPLPDGERLGRFGQFVRRTSLDELPSLINVIKGDLSLVGPRPLLVEYLPLYTVEEKRRHEVAPGITGWAQVNGRNDLAWEDKFHLDIWYAEHVSLALDLRILFLTVYRVLSGKGVASKQQATTAPLTAFRKV